MSRPFLPTFPCQMVSMWVPGCPWKIIFLPVKAPLKSRHRTVGLPLFVCHTGSSTGPAWHAETDLLQNLAAETTLGHALRVFNAHRNSFLDFDEELVVLKQLGIQSIRVPISWCLTDEDPATIDPKDTDIPSLEERFTCPDPFFDGVLWPAGK
jgi:hypothetical protein